MLGDLGVHNHHCNCVLSGEKLQSNYFIKKKKPNSGLSMTLEYFPVFFRTCFTIPGLSRPGKLLWNSRTFHDFKYLYYLCSSDYVSLISFTWHKKIIWSDFFSCGHLELAAILNWLPSWTGCLLELAAIYNWLPSSTGFHLELRHIWKWSISKTTCVT